MLLRKQSFLVQNLYLSFWFSQNPSRAHLGPFLGLVFGESMGTIGLTRKSEPNLLAICFRHILDGCKSSESFLALDYSGYNYLA